MSLKRLDAKIDKEEAVEVVVPKTKKTRQNGQKNEKEAVLSDEYAIRKDVPIPKQGRRTGMVDKFPLASMAVKDSFLTKIPYTKSAQNKIGGMIRIYVKKKKIKMEFSARKDESSGFLAVWRVR
jgi:hypothetical protein